jgi:hypothetical protein
MVFRAIVLEVAVLVPFSSQVTESRSRDRLIASG